MRYLSVCSGIEAATVAWHPLGWKPVAFSEIEAFTSAVLAHRFPDIPNLGDMTAHAAWPLQSGGIDLLVGGTPCQSFSVAGLRKGLADPRGNLALVYLGIAARLRPRWIVWENVPGVLSSGGGRDFGAFLGALGQLGYGWAYRTLDAQWFGVAQRRRRVFVVAHIGDWRRAAAVLFESTSLLRNPPSRGEARQAAPSDAAGCSASGRKWPADIAATLNAAFGEKQGLEDQHALGGASHFVPHSVTKWWDGSDCAASMTTKSHDQSVPDKGNFAAVVQAYSPHGHYRYEASEQSATLQDRENRQSGSTHLVAQVYGVSEELTAAENVMPCIQRGGDGGRHEFVAKAFRKSKRAQSENDDESWVDDGIANTLNGFDTGDTRTTHAVAFTQNQREEVRELGPVTGALSGQGTHQTTYVAQPVQFTIDMPACKGNANIGDGSVSPTLCKPSGNDVHAVAIGMNSEYNALTESMPTIKRGGEGGRQDIVAFSCKDHGGDASELCPTLRAMPHSTTHQNGGGQVAIAFHPTQDPISDSERTHALGCGSKQGCATVAVATSMVVRRLTPVECERLQGFPDGWTDIPYRGKPAPDGPRYKALGNSMAVPVMRWIGERIAAWEAR